MRKNFGSKSWFYPLPVLILGTYKCPVLLPAESCRTGAD